MRRVISQTLTQIVDSSETGSTLDRVATSTYNCTGIDHVYAPVQLERDTGALAKPQQMTPRS